MISKLRIDLSHKTLRVQLSGTLPNSNTYLFVFLGGKHSSLKQTRYFIRI